MSNRNSDLPFCGAKRRGLVNDQCPAAGFEWTSKWTPLARERDAHKRPLANGFGSIVVIVRIYY
ncbi:hypothetical protein DPMN_146316 [Dreissena polymorpha]|uniref:Uncharacterized protein n=1 Tax=Dreissena polymorpha TaxID=45954 RepID=A0A9D4J279_DREPO|nr:hypothetical protein DPMN_146316 [Dreissena polymorpha]